MMTPTIPVEIQQQAEQQASHCRVMGNPQRIMILWFLADQERTVTEIALAIGASLQSTSHHLRILEFSDMVKTRREHHNIFYHLINNEMVNRCPVLINRPKFEFTEATPT